MSVITVDSSKEQKDTSTENPVQGNSNNVSESKGEVTPESKGEVQPDSKGEVPPDMPAENPDVSVDSKSVSLGSVANGVIDASYASDVSSKLNTSKEKEALNASFE